MKQENARVAKWQEMLLKFPEPDPKLKTRARKGIPDAIRGYAWRILIHGHNKTTSDKTAEYTTQFKELMEAEADQKLIISIFKDVSRTMPYHVYF